MHLSLLPQNSSKQGDTSKLYYRGTSQYTNLPKLPVHTCAQRTGLFRNAGDPGRTVPNIPTKIANFINNYVV